MDRAPIPKRHNPERTTTQFREYSPESYAIFVLRLDPNGVAIATGGMVSLGSFGLAVAGFMVSRATGIGPAASLLSTGTLQAQERLLVTNFQVSGIDSTLAGAVTFAARTALSQSRAVSILSAENVEAALQRMRRPRTTPVDLSLGRELAQREGIRVVVAGQVFPAGRSLQVSLKLVSADSGLELAEVHRAADGPERLIATVDALSRDLRGRIGESLRLVRQTPPLPQATTHSLRALQLFSQHLNEPDPATALSLLRQAIAADSDFASAHRRLWVVRTGSPEGDSALVRAVRLAGHLPERERLQVEAAHYFALYLFRDADRAKSIATYRQLAGTGDPVGLINLPEALINRRQWAEAESLSRINVERMPNVTNSKETLIRTLVEQGKLDEADRMIASALRQHPGFWPFELWQLRMLYFRGRYDEFDRVLDSVRVLPDQVRRRVATNLKRRIAEIRGRLGERDRLSAEFRSLQAAAQNNLVDQVDRASTGLYRALDTGGDTAAAVRELEAALDSTRNQTGFQTFNVASALSAARRPDLARMVVARYRESSDLREALLGREMFVHKAMGAIAIAEGRPREGVEEVRRGDMLPDGPWHPCAICYYRDIAKAFDAAGDADSAIVYFERFATSPSLFSLDTHPGELAIALRKLGELHERKGNRQEALAWYERFATLWQNADPVLQPQVRDVSERIRRLQAGP